MRLTRRKAQYSIDMPASPVGQTAPISAIAEAGDDDPPNTTRPDSNQSMSTSSGKLKRPKTGSRKSSGTIIVPRDHPSVESRNEVYDEGDTRTMSPRRNSTEIAVLVNDTRQALQE